MEKVGGNIKTMDLHSREQGCFSCVPVGVDMRRRFFESDEYEEFLEYIQEKV